MLYTKGFALIPEAILNLTEASINKALRTDTLAVSELASLKGKIFAVECQSPALPISLEADHQGIRLTNGISDQASVVLSGTLPDLMRLGLSLAKNESDFSSSGVEIRGDVSALLQLSRVLARLEMDWEEILGSLIGEIPARLFFLGLERFQQVAPDIQEKTKEVSANFLSGPAGMATSDQASEVRERLRQLQYRLDRIQARLNKLMPEPEPEQG